MSTFPVILSFMTFFVSQTSITSFFSSVEKLNISAIYKSIILIFNIQLGPLGKLELDTISAGTIFMKPPVYGS